MLRELSITHFALIDELRVEFGAGLNVLTGETGAGKSILIDALGLALGTKGEAEQIRTGAEEATVEAAFDLVGEEARRPLADSGIECLPDEFLVVRRLLLREGKSKAYVNGRLSSAALLRDLAELLIEVHGQHQGPGLTQPSRQRLLLDAYAGLTGDVAAFRVLYNRRQALREELGSLQAGEREKAQRIDLLQHQRGEIAAARLTDGEEEELIQERTILAHVASIQDAAAQLRDYREGVEFDPERLEQVEVRLHEVGKLKRKYGGSIAEILKFARSADEELHRLMRSEERGLEVERELGALEANLSQQAAALTARRTAAAARLAMAVRQELQALRMEKAAFAVQVRARPGSGGSHLEASGADEVEFLIAPNPGEELKPLGRIASGGELSRVMLAIKAILAASDQIPTLVFDEVDVGIGGGMAEVVGQKLWAIGRERQVLSITHLPQIAALADRHLSISKRVKGTRTETAVQVLDGEEKVREIARMLGSKGRSRTPIQHAQEILEAARRWKAANSRP
ncbi:MAG: DNA repair protein RecN [candidate division NC10 bacterium]|nr:DNA repair protein RecN [candidate division NC10 bacterium]